MLLSSVTVVALALLAAGESKECSNCVSCGRSAHRHDNVNTWINDGPKVDFLLLVIQNVQAFCLNHHCVVNPASSWTIHGLWPSQKGTMDPAYCNSSSEFNPNVIQDLMNKMESDWPSLLDSNSASLWSHEWCKHGTCAVAAHISSDEQSYFSKVLSLFQNYDIGETLTSAGIKPSNSTAYSVDKVLSAFTVVPKLDCMQFHGRQFLVEIRMCYTTDFQHVACHESWFDDDQPCHKDQDLYYL